MDKDLTHIWQTFHNADCIFSDTQVDLALDKIAQQITDKLKDSNPLIYAVMNGGLILAGRLLPRLVFPLEVSYIHATRYGNELKGAGLNWRVRPTHDLRNRVILVLDDVLDEGHTLAAIMDYFKQEGALKIYNAVLVDKEHKHKAYPDMKADFTGLYAPDRFLFGSGMDYKGYWRNAPGIYAIKP